MTRLRPLSLLILTAQWRINGVVVNMPEFRDAFQCKAGSPMVREPVCRVW
jgi:putative endopeptidase